MSGIVHQGRSKVELISFREGIDCHITVFMLSQRLFNNAKKVQREKSLNVFVGFLCVERKKKTVTLYKSFNLKPLKASVDILLYTEN